MPFWTFFRNTAIITISVVVFSVVSNFIVAYGFACIEWPGRNKVFFIVLATLFLPFPVTLIPMFDMWAGLGFVNTWVPLIAPALFAGGFFTFLLRQFMLQTPKDMMDAARVDGASEWSIAWRIVFPTARPGGHGDRDLRGGRHMERLHGPPDLPAGRRASRRSRSVCRCSAP